MKYVSFYLRRTFGWYTIPANVDWDEYREAFIEFGSGLLKVIVIILLSVFWLFMLVAAPLAELLALPVRLWLLRRTIRKNQDKINSLNDLRTVRGGHDKYVRQVEDLRASGKTVEAEFIQQTIDMLEKRIVELELGMTKR